MQYRVLDNMHICIYTYVLVFTSTSNKQNYKEVEELFGPF